MNSEAAGSGNISTLRSIAVRTRSLAEMRRFYGGLGIRMRDRAGVLDDDYLEMDLGGGVVMTVRPESPFQRAEAGIDLHLAVDEPERRIAAVLALLHPGMDAGGSVSINMVLSDPDGRRIMLAART